MTIKVAYTNKPLIYKIGRECCVSGSRNNKRSVIKGVMRVNNTCGKKYEYATNGRCFHINLLALIELVIQALFHRICCFRNILHVSGTMVCARTVSAYMVL